jgi:tetraacyldisaccharide 4'-kinase
LENKKKIELKIGASKLLFFSFIDYDDLIISNAKQLKVSDIRNKTKLLVAGIAKPKDFYSYLQHENDKVITYADHHNFSDSDILDIKTKAKNDIIITTEKDFVRLNEKLQSDNLFYLPIKSSFLFEGDNFDKTILNYVGTSTRNR